MIIDPDVPPVAKQFGTDPAFVQAVVNAEGGGDHIITAVQCSIPSITTRERALEVVCRSANHALWAYVSSSDPAGFVAFFGSRWAPLGVKNDPHDLNRNFVLNVLSAWKKTL